MSNDIVAQELQRYGMIYRNREFYTDRAAYVQWYAEAYAEVDDFPFENRVDCYKRIGDYFRQKEAVRRR